MAFTFCHNPLKQTIIYNFMIYLFFTLLFLISACSALFCGIKQYSDQKCTDWFIGLFMISIILFLLCAGGTFAVARNVNRANYLQAKIQLMQPSSIDGAKLKRAEMELKSVSNLIEEAFAKYQIQAKTEDFKNFKMYTMPFSGTGLNFQGLGDIERGAGEKLKNLEALIEKQWELAEKIIELQTLVFKPEFYSLNHELHALKYSIFDGVVVRWFVKDVKVVYNQEIYANGVQINNNL